MIARLLCKFISNWKLGNIGKVITFIVILKFLLFKETFSVLRNILTHVSGHNLLINNNWKIVKQIKYNINCTPSVCNSLKVNSVSVDKRVPSLL